MVMDHLLTAFFEEMRKLAWSVEDMKKVLKLSKARSMRIPLKVNPLGATAWPAKAVGQNLSAIEAAVQQGAATPAQAGSMRNFLQNLKGKISFPKGGVVKQFKEQVDPSLGRALTGRQKFGLEALTRGHEMDEMAAAAKKFNPAVAREITHVSPDVVLRERNRVLTSPADIREGVGGVFSAIRKPEEALLERATRGVSGQGLSYGEGPRLSRHARRHVSERMSELAQRPDVPTVGKVMQGVMDPERLGEKISSFEKIGVSVRLSDFMQTRAGRRPIRAAKLLSKDRSGRLPDQKSLQDDADRESHKDYEVEGGPGMIEGTGEGKI